MCIMEYYSSSNDDIIGHEIIEHNSIEILYTTNQLTCILFLIVFILIHNEPERIPEIS